MGPKELAKEANLRSDVFARAEMWDSILLLYGAAQTDSQVACRAVLDTRSLLCQGLLVLLALLLLRLADCSSCGLLLADSILWLSALSVSSSALHLLLRLLSLGPLPAFLLPKRRPSFHLCLSQPPRHQTVQHHLEGPHIRTASGQ